MNVIVLVAHGLHLGYIGCYGNEWVQTPHLDRLAAEGIAFDQHFADQPDPPGVERAWRTGCYSFPLALEEATFQDRPDLFPLLAERSVATFLVQDSKIQSAPTESHSWQHFHCTEMPTSLTMPLEHLSSCEKWLLRLDLGMLLPPWDTPDEFRDYYIASGQDEDDQEPSEEFEPPEDAAYLERQNRYAAAVTHLDAVIGKVLGEVEERGLLREALILVTADQGQKLGEEASRPGSRLLLHEELIHIPLLLRLPQKAFADRRVPAFTQSIDLLPTLCEAFGVSLPPVHGQSLLPLATGQKNSIREYACAGLRTGDAIEWALRSPHWAFLMRDSSRSSDSPVETEFYVKPDDRWEVNDVRHLYLDLTEHLKETVRNFALATHGPGPLQLPRLPDLEVAMAKEQERTTQSAERTNQP